MARAMRCAGGQRSIRSAASAALAARIGTAQQVAPSSKARRYVSSRGT
jgi:hypothetical protein